MAKPTLCNGTLFQSIASPTCIGCLSAVSTQERLDLAISSTEAMECTLLPGIETMTIGVVPIAPLHTGVILVVGGMTVAPTPI